MLEQHGEPFVGLVVKKHVAFPLGVEQVFVRFRRLGTFDQIGVVAENDGDDTEGRKKSISIFARTGKEFALRWRFQLS